MNLAGLMSAVGLAPATKDSEPRIPAAAAIVLLTLPFMQLFSIDVGFPLKIYELTIILWAGLSLLTLRITIFDKNIFARSILFSAYTLIALFINLKVLGDEGDYNYLARFTPLMDGLLKACYCLMCILGFNLIAYAASIAPRRAAHFWLTGAFISACIHLFLFTVSFFNLGIPALPGMIPLPRDQQLIDFGGHIIFRAGTFIEGNTAGPYFVLTFLIAMACRRYLLALMFVLVIAASFSTTAFIALGAALAFMALKDSRNLAYYAMTAVCIFALLAFTGLLDTIILQKLADNDSHASIVQREKTFQVAMDMFEHNPFLGVGLAQFGMHTEGWKEWVQIGGVAIDTHIFQKDIPNNVYAEMACELGMIGIAFFLLFFVPVLLLAWKCPYPQLKAGIIALFFFLIASPTFILMYYWTYLGLVCGIARFAQIRAAALPDIQRGESRG